MKSKSTLSKSVNNNKSVAFAAIEDVSTEDDPSLLSSRQDATSPHPLIDDAHDVPLPCTASSSKAQLQQYAQQVFAPSVSACGPNMPTALASPRVTFGAEVSLHEDSLMPGLSKGPFLTGCSNQRMGWG